jgi:tripartite-type tricarboxylate transporter receptor subunit TctC
MRLPRRAFLRLAAGVAALPALAHLARAQAYPARPVRVVSGFPAGSQTDIVARLIGQWLQERLGQPFIVEDRPGAAGNIATEAVVKSPADGYTLLMLGSSHANNATLYDNLKFNVMRDIAPIAAIVNVPNVVVVNPSVKAKTIPEFTALAKAQPGKINMGSAGSGSSGHLAGELFMAMTGVQMTHVPYRGSPAVLTDLIGGRVDVYFSTMPGAIEHIRAGTLRALAVTSASRSQALPDVPALSEFVPGYDAGTWTGIGAPKDVPADILDRLHNEVEAGLADAKLKASFADIGGVTLPGSSADFAKLIAVETEKWGKVIRSANIRLE